MVMEWENNMIQIKAPHLQPLLNQIHSQLGKFSSITFNHVYCELNEEAYQKCITSSYMLVDGGRAYESTLCLILK